MLDLSTYFDDHFDDIKHSNAELLRYTTQHYAITSNPLNNPGGIWDANNTATLTALTSFATCVGDKTFNLGVRKAANAGKKIFRTGLFANLARVVAAIEATYGKGSPDYIACLPEGREGITGATEDLLKGKLQALHDALAARSAVALIGAQVSVVAGWITTWTALLAAADVADGTELGSDETRRACRKALTMQLSRNALSIALHFLGQPEKAPVYLPQSLLENPVSTSVPDAPVVVSNYAGGNDVPLGITCDGDTDTVKILRRMVGELDYTQIAADVAVDGSGHATFTDTLPGPGHFEYVAVAVNSAGDSAQSNAVVALAD